MVPALSEQLSHELALRFASKCYTHLEIAHFKDNFKSLADHQGDVEYWREDTLCRFLALPEPLRAGPVIFHMATYLGAFPFPSLAPCILTREAMLKVVTIMTGRYKKILKRGNQDKVKLLFRSLAVYDRKAAMPLPPEKASVLHDGATEQIPEDVLAQDRSEKDVQSRPSGFAVDEPANDDEDEDEDDLALAALDALDAIEVFKQDQKTDHKVHRAMIPVQNFKRLLMVLLLFGGLEPQSAILSFGEDLNEERMGEIDASATAMLAAFDPDPNIQGIRYTNFVKTASVTMPDLFEPFSPLFEHFLFSKNINLSRHRDAPNIPALLETPKSSPIYRSPEDTSPSIFTDTILSQMSTSIRLLTPTSTLANIFQSGARFNQLYSTASHGTSLSSFGRHVLSWKSATILLISGTLQEKDAHKHSHIQSIVLGAYLPDHWRDSSYSSSSSSSSNRPTPSTDPSTRTTATLFQLQPRHAIFPANPYNRSTPVSHFSTKTGIALGCVVPQASRAHSQNSQVPILGPVSLLIDTDFLTATFQHDPDAGSGAFLPDPGLEAAQLAMKPSSSSSSSSSAQPKKLTLDIDALEVWGVSFPLLTTSGNAGQAGEPEDELTRQKKRLAWEDAEAARRRGVNFGGDKDGARALLEMAGLVGDKAGNRSGGSV